MQNNFSFFVVDVQSTQKQNQSWKGRITWDGFQPVVYWHFALGIEEKYNLRIALTVKAEKDHLRLRRSLTEELANKAEMLNQT